MPSTIHKVRGEGLKYFVGPDAHHLEGVVEPPGIWMGRLAADLGIAGEEVELSAIQGLARGRDPATSERMCERNNVRNLAYDLIFTAPKSVSVLFALGDAAKVSAIARAHEGAIAATVDYLERHTAWVARTKRHVVHPADGLVAASFRHRTSRAPDPHLHTHLVVMNVTRGDDGRWSALDARELYANIRTANALFGAHLRHGLAHEGLVFHERRAGLIDLAGAPDRFIRTFSRRSVELRGRADDFGSATALGRKVSCDYTRADRHDPAEWTELLAEWREMGARAGITRSDVHALGQPRWADRNHVAEPPEVERIVASFDVPFTRSELVAALANRTVNGAPVPTIERLADAALASRLVSPRPRARFANDPSGEWSIPRAVGDSRWVSADVASAIDQVEDVLSKAPLMLGSLDSSPDVVRVRNDVAGLRAVREAVVATQAAGGKTVAIAPNVTLAGHYAAMTGLDVVAAEKANVIRADRVVVFGAKLVRPRLVATWIDECVNNRASLVLADRHRPRHMTDRELATMENIDVSRRQWDLHIDRGLRLADGPEAILRVLLSTVNEIRATGRPSVVVAIDGISDSVEHGLPVVGARRATLAAQRIHNLVAVVVGDLRVLGSAGLRAFEDRRLHVMVEPLDLARSRELALSLEPPSRRRGYERERLGLEL